MDRVASEVAEEVLVLLQDDHLDPGPRQEQAEHHPGRPSAGDAALRRRPIRLGSSLPRVHGRTAVSRAASRRAATNKDRPSSVFFTDPTP